MQQMRVNEMKFICPKKTYTECNCSRDITVSIIKGGSTYGGKESNRNTLSFISRNGKDRSFAPDGYVQILPIGNRIYFKGARSSAEGFKLGAKGTATDLCRYFKFNFALYGYEFDDMKQYIGDYDLKYDKREELYYIEVEPVIKTTSTGDNELKARYGIGDNSTRW